MTTAVTLGAINLDSFEVPTFILYGGDQRAVVHDLPGGSRVLDVLGSADHDIIFNGVLSGSNAEQRAVLLDTLRISGAAVPLSWGDNYFMVILSRALFSYRKSWWIPYQIRCTVVVNPLAIAVNLATSVASSILGDLTSAAALVPDAPPGLAAAQTGLAQATGTTPGAAAYQQNLADLSTSQASLQSATSQSGAMVSGFDLGMPAGSPVAGASGLSQVANASASLANSAAAAGYVGRGLSLLSALGG
ncbi:hypothetical protein [Acidisoma sp. C75]